MISQYLDVALRELSDRLVWLKSNRPHDLEAEYDVVSQAVGSEVDRLVDEVGQTLDELQSEKVGALSNVVFRYREIIGEANTLETIVLPALSSVSNRDIALSKLLRAIHREIGFPIQCPAVTMISQESFWILGEFHLLAVPFREDNSPLQVPALYHELGHLLSAEENDSRVRPFQESLLLAAMQVLEHFRGRETHSSRRRVAKEIGLRWKAWRTLWTKHWVEEFACDAFAAATAGPAYGWAFVHGAMGLGTDPFELPGNAGASEHPADAARLHVICSVLDRNGWQDEVNKLKSFLRQGWEAIGAKETTEFGQCYPAVLLESVAKQFLDATFALNCDVCCSPPSDSIRGRLLDCWHGVLAGAAPRAKWQEWLTNSR